MAWEVAFDDDFLVEFGEFSDVVQIEILALAKMLEEMGPRLGRPHADTLKDSKFANMKELRFSAADGEWRVAFAFDVKRMGILLCAGDKSGISEKRFYRQLIARADTRFSAHMARLKKDDAAKAAKGARS